MKSFVIILLFCNLMLIAESGNQKKRPLNVPEKAKWSSGKWRLYTEKENGKYMSWYDNGTMFSLYITNLDKTYIRQYHPNGKLKTIGQTKKGKRMLGCNPDNPSEEGKIVEGDIPYGLWREYDTDGFLQEITCQTPNLNPEYAGHYCGEQVSYKKNGSIDNIVTYKQKCELGCGVYRPFIEIGEYKIHEKGSILYKSPSANGDIITVLLPYSYIQVIEDIKKIETIGDSISTWVRVKTKDGKEGYIPAAYILQQ